MSDLTERPNNPEDWAQKTCWDIAESIRGDPDGFTNKLNELEIGVFELERVMLRGGYLLCNTCDCWYETEDFKPMDPTIESSPKACSSCRTEYAPAMGG